MVGKRVSAGPRLGSGSRWYEGNLAWATHSTRDTPIANAASCEHLAPHSVTVKCSYQMSSLRATLPVLVVIPY